MGSKPPNINTQVLNWAQNPHFETTRVVQVGQLPTRPNSDFFEFAK